MPTRFIGAFSRAVSGVAALNRTQALQPTESGNWGAALLRLSQRSLSSECLIETKRLANRLQLLLEALPGGVVVLDGDGRVEECNPAATEILDHPLRGGRWRDIAASIISPQADDEFDLSLRNLRRVSITTRSLGSEPGQILLVQDVTEKREMQAKLSGAKRLCEMGEMMAALAHQIRTPLASALLHATNLQSYPDQHQRLMPKLVERLRNLERLLDGMLCFAREGALEVVEIPIADLLNDFSSCLKGEPSDGIAAMEMDAVALSARIVGNAPALRSVFQNLVNNARQAGGPDVTLRARTRLDGEGLEILLSDDGPGIAPELRERVFEPFVTTQPDGVGLGLAIARRIIESHRGTLTLGQEARAGATFIIRLPACYISNTSGSGLGSASR